MVVNDYIEIGVKKLHPNWTTVNAKIKYSPPTNSHKGGTNGSRHFNSRDGACTTYFILKKEKILLQ